MTDHSREAAPTPETSEDPLPLETLDDSDPVDDHSGPSSETGADRGPKSRTFTFSRKREILLVGGILLFALLFRVVFFIEAHDAPPLHLHEWDHCDAARFHLQAAHMAEEDDWLMEGIVTDPPSRFIERGVEPPPYTGVVYAKRPWEPKSAHIYFFATIYRIFGPRPHAVAWVHFLLGLATLLLTYLAVRKLLGRGPAGIALALGVLYPTLIVFEAAPLRATLFTFWTALVLFLVVSNFRGRSLWCWGGVGLALGFMNQIYWLVFIPYMILLGAMKLAVPGERSRGRSSLSTAAGVGLFRRRLPAMLCVLAMLGGFFLLEVPIRIRNGVVGEEPEKAGDSGNAPSAVDEILLNSPEVSGDGLRFGVESRSLVEETRGKDVSKLWVMNGLARLHGGWPQLLWFMTKKLRYFFRWRETPQNANFYKAKQYSVVLRWMPVSMLFLSPLAVMGALLLLIRPPENIRVEVVLIASLCAPALARIALGYFTARHRLPCVPVFLFFAAFAIWFLWRCVREKKPKLVLPLLAALVLIGLVVHPPSSSCSLRVRPADDIVAARFYMKRQASTEAKREYEAALNNSHSRAPALVEAHRQLGLLYAAEGRFTESLDHLRKALRIHPGDEKTHSALRQVRAKMSGR
ncbi:MAG: tetratricopeptide repeat protein [Planctomycetota bacterium]|jgi:hypothetical protein